MRLRKYMTETLLDQLPVLVPFQRSLEELNFVADSSISQKNPWIVQQMPEMRARIMKDRNWSKIAQTQIKEFFTLDDKDLKEEYDKIMKLYNSDVFEEFLDDPKCADCGKPAKQRCSKCKNQWYCSRDCQLRQWKAHKPICTMITS